MKSLSIKEIENLDKIVMKIIIAIIVLISS